VLPTYLTARCYKVPSQSCHPTSNPKGFPAERGQQYCQFVQTYIGTCQRRLTSVIYPWVDYSVTQHRDGMCKKAKGHHQRVGHSFGCPKPKWIIFRGWWVPSTQQPSLLCLSDGDLPEKVNECYRPNKNIKRKKSPNWVKDGKTELRSFHVQFWRFQGVRLCGRFEIRHVVTPHWWWYMYNLQLVIIHTDVCTSAEA
jgi:hypothetical protein